jgi:hypothetical protein
VHVTLSNTLVTDHIAIIVTQSISSVNNATWERWQGRRGCPLCSWVLSACGACCLKHALAAFFASTAASALGRKLSEVRQGETRGFEFLPCLGQARPSRAESPYYALLGLLMLPSVCVNVRA